MFESDEEFVERVVTIVDSLIANLAQARAEIYRKGDSTEGTFLFEDEVQRYDAELASVTITDLQDWGVQDPAVELVEDLQSALEDLKPQDVEGIADITLSNVTVAPTIDGDGTVIVITGDVEYTLDKEKVMSSRILQQARRALQKKDAALGYKVLAMYKRVAAETVDAGFAIGITFEDEDYDEVTEDVGIIEDNCMKWLNDTFAGASDQGHSGDELVGTVQVEVGNQDQIDELLEGEGDGISVGKGNLGDDVLNGISDAGKENIADVYIEFFDFDADDLYPEEEEESEED